MMALDLTLVPVPQDWEHADHSDHDPILQSLGHLLTGGHLDVSSSVFRHILDPIWCLDRCFVLVWRSPSEASGLHLELQVDHSDQLVHLQLVSDEDRRPLMESSTIIAPASSTTGLPPEMDRLFRGGGLPSDSRILG